MREAQDFRRERRALERTVWRGPPGRLPWLSTILVVAGLAQPAAAVRTGAALESSGQRFPAIGVVTDALTGDLVMHVLGLVPLRPRMAWSPDGRSVALQHDWGICEELGGAAEHNVKLSFFPKGRRLLAAGSEGAGIIWNALSGSMVRALRHEPVELLDAQVFPDGRRIVCLTADRRANIFSVASGELVHSLVRPLVPHLLVRVFADSERLTTGASILRGDAAAVIWNVTDGEMLHSFELVDEVTAFLALSQCGGTLVTAGGTSVAVWDTATGALRRHIRSPVRWASGIDVSGGGAKVVGSEQRCLMVWDAILGRPQLRFCASAPITAFRILPGSRRVVAITPAEAIVWDLDRGIRLMLLEGGVGFMAQSIAVSPNGDAIAACGGAPMDDMVSGIFTVTTKAWELATGRLIYHVSDEDAQDIDMDDAFMRWYPCSVAIGSIGDASELVQR